MANHKATLEVLTPIHIGSKEQQLSPWDYVVVEGICFVLSFDRLQSALAKRNLQDQFVASLKREPRV